jgi:outer membrane protein assembly factor BamE (lipoprotein component of BamABCDE complex)
MKKLYFIQLLLFSIVFSSWNNPYINTDETLKLEYGMSKSSVLETLGNPLYVDKGWPVSGSNTIVWVYKVRTTDVHTKQAVGEPVEVVKSSNSKKPSSGEHHDLVLTFKDNKLVNWESKMEEKSSSTIEMPSIPSISVASVTSSSLAIDFKLSIVNEDYDWYGYEDDWYDYHTKSESGLRLGANFSKSMFGMNVGLDISLLTGGGIMLFLEKEIFGFDFAVSFGSDTFESESAGELYSTLKFGIFRDFTISGYPLSFGIENMVRDSDNYDYEVSDASSTLMTVKYKFR